MPRPRDPGGRRAAPEAFNRVSRRQFLSYVAAGAALAGCRSLGDGPSRGAASASPPPRESSPPPRVVVTTDFAVPHVDPDDYYDVACGVALGVHGFVLDHPTDAAASAIRQIGGRVLEPSEIADAHAVVVIGAGTNAAAHYRAGQRVVLFAGDAQGVPEYNQLLDSSAYDYLRPRSRWVPCFSGGLWQSDERASWVRTTDDVLLDGQASRCWFDEYISDVLGDRNLWVGPLMRFAWADEWRGSSVASGQFRAGPGFVEAMVSGTRDLVSQAVASCAAAA